LLQNPQKPMILLHNKLSNFKSIKEWKKTNKHLMTGYQYKHKEDSETGNPSTSIE